MPVHHPGDVWKLENVANWWIQNLKCKGCNKGFELGQWVVQSTSTPRRSPDHGIYARIRHIECFTDAKGKPIRRIPNDHK